jgi:hypothetical protein
MFGPSGLYDHFYPAILKRDIPASLIYCLKSSLEWDPLQRTSFQEMFNALSKDDSDSADFEDLNGALEIYEDNSGENLMSSPKSRSFQR